MEQSKKMQRGASPVYLIPSQMSSRVMCVCVCVCVCVCSWRLTDLRAGVETGGEVGGTHWQDRTNACRSTNKSFKLVSTNLCCSIREQGEPDGTHWWTLYQNRWGWLRRLELCGTIHTHAKYLDKIWKIKPQTLNSWALRYTYTCAKCLKKTDAVNSTR